MARLAAALVQLIMFCVAETVVPAQFELQAPPRLHENDDGDDLHVYLVVLTSPAALLHYDGSIRGMPRPKLMANSRIDMMNSDEAVTYKAYLMDYHDSLLERSSTDELPRYQKLYSYYYLISGFAALMPSKQAALLARMPEVAVVETDRRIQKLTTYTPSYLGLTSGAWSELSSNGTNHAGEGIVIGVVDTGIDPTHPSFANSSSNPYYLYPRGHHCNEASSSSRRNPCRRAPSTEDPSLGVSHQNGKHCNDPCTRSSASHAASEDPLPHFQGECEVAHEFPAGSCNGKIVAARHFAKAAIVNGLFNNSIREFASPRDADGHGTHTASIAAGNQGVPLQMVGMNFGNASGMAPRARLAIYKALYAGFGGFYADVVAAINQATEDGVDVLSLSIGPPRPPSGLATYFNSLDMTLLLAVKAGVFVVQAAGNGGPYPFSVISFSPWIFTVGAASHDRTYSNHILLENNITIKGVGLSSGTKGEKMYALVLASQALKDNMIGGVPSHGMVSEEYRLAEECQDPTKLEETEVKDKILICTFTFSFLIGSSTMKQAEATAQTLKATGLVLRMSPWLEGFQLQADYMPFSMPTIVINNGDDSQTLLKNIVEKLNSSALHGRILGYKASFSQEAPMVVSYSSRGPDPANNKYRAANILKPNIVAPGSSIWGAWTPIGVESLQFKGEKFAILSGTSMAAPHIAGIAALVKQKNKSLSPAGIASAMATTATWNRENGSSILITTRSGTTGQAMTTLATPLDMGSGLVNGTAALDPGLIFDASFKDFIQFLCTVPGSNSSFISKIVGDIQCPITNSSEYDLNAPYIVINKLKENVTIPRTVTHIARENETYHVEVVSPRTASVSVNPSTFSLKYNESKCILIMLELSSNSTNNRVYDGPISSFGSILFIGTQGHHVHIPVVLIEDIY